MDTQEQKPAEAKKYWFVVKHFGLGWRPVTWQGWVATFIYVSGLIHFATENNKQHSASDFFLNFGFDFVVLSVFFLALCYYTGEKPKWPWGQKGIKA